MAWLGLALFAGYCIGRPYGTGPGRRRRGRLGDGGQPALLAPARQRQQRRRRDRALPLLGRAAAQRALAGAVWVCGNRGRAGPPSGTLLVAGLAAGLALGTKLTVVPPVLALTVGVIWISGAGYRLRAAAEWIGAMVVGGRLLVRAQPDRLRQPVPLAGHRADPPRRGPAGPPSVLDRPLRDRHRASGAATSPRPCTSASASSGRPIWRSRWSRWCWCSGAAGGWSGCWPWSRCLRRSPIC